MIPGVFCDFRSDRTPPGPPQNIVITMVWGASACRGARGGAFSIFHEKFMKIHKNHENSLFHEISRNFMKFMEIMEIIDFWGSGGLKTLIFLWNYWCFCNGATFAKIMIFSEIHGIHEISQFSTFSLKSIKESNFMKKVPGGAQGT